MARERIENLLARRMVAAGKAWLAAHPTAQPRLSGSDSLYGLPIEANADARELSRVVLAEVAVWGSCPTALLARVLNELIAHREQEKKP